MSSLDIHRKLADSESRFDQTTLLNHMIRPLLLPAGSFNANELSAAAAVEWEQELKAELASGYSVAPRHASMQHCVDKVTRWQCLPGAGPASPASARASSAFEREPEHPFAPPGTPRDEPQLARIAARRHKVADTPYPTARNSAASTAPSTPSAHSTRGGLSGELSLQAHSTLSQSRKLASSSASCENFLADRLGSVAPAPAWRQECPRGAAAPGQPFSVVRTDFEGAHGIPLLAKPLRCPRLESRDAAPVIIGTPPRPLTFLS